MVIIKHFYIEGQMSLMKKFLHYWQYFAYSEKWPRTKTHKSHRDDFVLLLSVFLRREKKKTNHKPTNQPTNQEAISMLTCNQTLDISPWNGSNNLLLLFLLYRDILQPYSNFMTIFSGFLQASTAHHNWRNQRCLTSPAEDGLRELERQLEMEQPSLGENGKLCRK